MFLGILLEAKGMALDRLMPWLAYAAVLIALYLYSYCYDSGLVLMWGDSWIYTDIAKRIAYTQSLCMNKVFDIVYPPLYSLMLSPGFLPRDINFAFDYIRHANILVYSSAFLPIYLLARSYAGLSATAGAIVSALLCTAYYQTFTVLHVMSESLFVPLIAWLFWSIWSELCLRSLWGVLASGLLLVALPLTKALGMIIFMAYILHVIAYYLSSVRRSEARVKRQYLLGQLGAVGSGLFFLALYKQYMHYAIPGISSDWAGYLGGGVMSLFSGGGLLASERVQSGAYWYERMRHSGSWLMLYTYTIVPALTVAMIVADPRKVLLRDRLVLAFVFSIVGLLIAVPFFTQGDPLVYVHSRYFIAFVFMFFLIYFRYVAEAMSAWSLVIAICILVIMNFIGLPLCGNMGEKAARVCKIADVHAVSTLCTWMAVALLVAWLVVVYRYRDGRAKITLIGMMLIMPLIAVVGKREKEPVVCSFRKLSPLIEVCLSACEKNPRAAFVVDEKWRGQDLQAWIESEMIMFGMQRLPRFDNGRNLVQIGQESVFVTHELLPAILLGKSDCLKVYYIAGGGSKAH